MVIGQRKNLFTIKVIFLMLVAPEHGERVNIRYKFVCKVFFEILYQTELYIVPLKIEFGLHEM
jgi:hypothetical protein